MIKLGDDDVKRVEALHAKYGKMKKEIAKTIVEEELGWVWRNGTYRNDIEVFVCLASYNDVIHIVCDT